MSDKIYTIEEIKSKLNIILKDKDVYSVILFGSYAKNTATQNSDIDLLIDTKGKLLGFNFYSLVTLIEENFEKDIDAFEKTELINNSKIYNEIKNTGIIIYKK